MSKIFTHYNIYYFILCKKITIFILLIKQLNITGISDDTEKEVPFNFEFTYTPGEPPTRDYPGDKPEVEIIKVTLNGVAIPLEALSEEMYQEMIEQILEHYY